MLLAQSGTPSDTQTCVRKNSPRDTCATRLIPAHIEKQKFARKSGGFPGTKPALAETMTRTLALSGLVVIFIACGGTTGGVPTDHPNPATGGSVAATDGGAANVGGSSGPGGGGGGGGGENCAQTHDSATINLTLDGSVANNVGVDSDTDLSASGVVTSVQADLITLESCPPTESCFANIVARVTINAPGLDLAQVVPVGALAQAHFVRKCPWGCTKDIIVTSLVTYGSLTNPSPANSGIYVAANDGGGAPDGVPYQLEQVKLSCPFDAPGTSCGGQESGLYLSRFTAPTTGDGFDLHMGETRWLRAGTGWVLLRNLRSYASGWCDDYWNWAHWAADLQSPP